jgi:hypothetical protein
MTAKRFISSGDERFHLGVQMATQVARSSL